MRLMQSHGSFCCIIKHMKKRRTILTCLSVLLLLSGCSKTEESESSSSGMFSYTETTTPISGDAYSLYSSMYSTGSSVPDNGICAVTSRYLLQFEDETYDSYNMDAVLETDGEKAYLTTHINSNGLTSETEGWYVNGRFYNDYNEVTYYEEMDLSDLWDVLLVPCTTYAFQESQIETISAGTDTEGNTVFEIILTDEAASALFQGRYDFNGLSQYDGFTLTDHIIRDTFDENGQFIGETAHFETSISYEGSPISIEYDSEMNLKDIGKTEVLISDDIMEELETYVLYTDVDTDAIAEGSLEDDEPEATVTETFKKRLVSRLNYELQEDGTYVSEYNDTESYTVDFENKTFKYQNRSIVYSYSWKGDVGSMGECTYSFETGEGNSSCVDDTMERIQDVKSYLEMELYYCGLSLKDLQAEG